MNRLCQTVGAEKRRSSPYHPEGNGQAERSIQTIKGIARRITAERKLEKYQWPTILQEATFMMNTTLNSGIGVTPFEAMHGDKAMLPSVIASPDTNTNGGKDQNEILEENRTKVRTMWRKVEEDLDRS